MQIIQQQYTTPETFQTEEGKFTRTFLISTKHNDVNWFIRRETGHEKVKTFLGRNLAIIPELIHKPISEGGGGHYHGSREEILKAYDDAGHGKIDKLYGPYYYQDSPEDYWYDARIKLNNSRSASVLMEEGQKTWNGFDVSPHIFVYKGSDETGWEDWEGAGLNLVIKGAFGPQAIISRFCSGSEDHCSKALEASSKNVCDETLAKMITSVISKVGSSQHTMSGENSPDKVTMSPPDAGLNQNNNNSKSNPTVDPQKGLTDSPKMSEQVTISKAEFEAMQNAVTDMENEKKTDLLTTLFESLPDGEEKDKALKEFSKHDLKTVKLLKSYYDRTLPKLEAKIKAKLKAEMEKEGEEKPEGDGGEKKAKAKEDNKKEEEKSKTASTAGPEPKVKFTTPNAEGEESREASSPQIRNEVWRLRQRLQELR